MAEPSYADWRGGLRALLTFCPHSSETAVGLRRQVDLAKQRFSPVFCIKTRRLVLPRAYSFFRHHHYQIPRVPPDCPSSPIRAMPQRYVRDRQREAERKYRERRP